MKEYYLFIGFGWAIRVPRKVYNFATEKTPMTGIVVMK
jgi:hypothetical protein